MEKGLPLETHGKEPVSVPLGKLDGLQQEPGATGWNSRGGHIPEWQTECSKDSAAVPEAAECSGRHNSVRLTRSKNAQISSKNQHSWAVAARLLQAAA